MWPRLLIVLFSQGHMRTCDVIMWHPVIHACDLVMCTIPWSRAILSHLMIATSNKRENIPSVTLPCCKAPALLLPQSQDLQGQAIPHSCTTSDCTGTLHADTLSLPICRELDLSEQFVGWLITKSSFLCMGLHRTWYFLRVVTRPRNMSGSIY